MKILQVFWKLDIGGAETRTIELMNHINSNKVDIEYVVLSGNRGFLDESLGNRIHYISLKKVNFIFLFLRLLYKEKYNVVHSHLFLFSGVIHFITFIAGVKIRISHIRTTGTIKTKFISTLIRNIEKCLMLIFSTHILCVSESVKRTLFKNSNNTKIRVFYNGFLYKKHGILDKDLEKIKELKIKNSFVIHIGRMINEKNHRKVLEVFYEHQKIEVNSVLVFIGKINEEIIKELNLYIQEKNIEKKVLFLGEKLNVQSYLEIADLMYFPSFREGLPGVLIEAMQYDVPVVASKIDPNIEVSQYFDRIKILSNDINNETWASEGIKLINNDKLPNPKEIFLTSPFSFNTHVEEYLKIVKEYN